MRFVANLRQETIDVFGAQDIQPEAYLLSSHRVSPAALLSAAEVRGHGLPLFADNGTKPLIDEAVRLFAEPARRIRDEVRGIRRQLGRVPRGQDIPPALRGSAAGLANEVVSHATAASDAIDTDELIDVQLSMDPTDLIAKEDFATACLIALDLDRETTGWPVSRFTTRNRRSLRLWKSVATDPRCDGVRIHAVLSAMDYNTARAAGRLAASEGVQHAALGLAGIMLDPSATDFHVVGTASLSLERPAPRRYVRLAQILRGIADGYAESGKALAGFHCLGLGAPPLMPIPPAALGALTAITTDATSPIHDAVRDHVLYDLENDGHRATIREIVNRIVMGGDWPFLSPFTQDFRSRFGHDPEAARGFWEDQGRPAITMESLRTTSLLTTALPLFSEADPSVRLAAARARIAHNHWVLGELCTRFPVDANRRRTAIDAMRQLLNGSGSATTVRGLDAALAILMRGIDESLGGADGHLLSPASAGHRRRGEAAQTASAHVGRAGLRSVAGRNCFIMRNSILIN